MNEKAFAERMAARKEVEAALMVDAVTRHLVSLELDPFGGYLTPIAEFNHMAARVLHGCDLRTDRYTDEVRLSIVGANQAQSASNQVYPPGRHPAKLQRRLP